MLIWTLFVPLAYFKQSILRGDTLALAFFLTIFGTFSLKNQRVTIPRIALLRLIEQKLEGYYLADRLDLEVYKRMKSSVERFFAWLTNGFRRLAIRWERLASTFTAFIQLACILIYLRVFR